MSHVELHGIERHRVGGTSVERQQRPEREE